MRQLIQLRTTEGFGLPLYVVARKKYKKGVRVFVVTGILWESGSSVERENKQSRISCPIDAHSLSAIYVFHLRRAIFYETHGNLLRGH